MPTPKKTLEPLKKLLYSAEVDNILQGIEFVISLDDKDLWDTLLDSVTWSADREDGSGPGFVPNRFFSGPIHMKPFRELALTLLVASSPKKALKAKAKALRMRARGGERPSKSLDVMPLQGIEKLPNLARIEIEVVSRMENVFEALSRCPALVEISLLGSYYTPPLSLSGIAACRGIERISLRSPQLSLSGIEGSPVRSLSIEYGSFDALPLCSLPSLRSLSLKSTHTKTSARPRAPMAALEELSLASVYADDLDFLAGAPSLSRIEGDQCRITDASALASLRLQGLPSFLVDESLDALLEALRKRGSEAIFDALLAPVALHDGHLSAQGSVPNPIAHGRAIRRLVGVASGREAERVSALLPSRWVEFPDRSTKTVDLRGFGRFHTVTDLEIPGAIRIIGASELGQLPALRRLVISGDDDLREMPRMSHLEEIVLEPSRWSKVDLSFLHEQPVLRSITLPGYWHDKAPPEVRPLIQR